MVNPAPLLVKEVVRTRPPPLILIPSAGCSRKAHDALSPSFQKGNPLFRQRQRNSSLFKEVGNRKFSEYSELLAICGLLENTARVKSYGRHDNADVLPDILDPLFDALEPLTPLSTRIRSCILSEDEIADDASSTLKQIRRSMKQAGDRIHSQLSSLLNGSMRTYLQDAVITMRNGRYCVPVKAEYRGQVPGMIHDQSSTGSTIFIEPMSIVKLNNDIRELENKEQAEIEVILANLSMEAAGYMDTIRYNLENMVELDFIFARASLAMEMNANEPLFNTEGRIRIRKGRHPLIDKTNVVPIDIVLGDTFDLLIITGPNTGGKTVSLKTVGLFDSDGAVRPSYPGAGPQ